MAYQNFTDLLHELKTKHSSSGPITGFLEAIEAELSGTHVKPKTIYRAVGQAYSTFTCSTWEEFKAVQRVGQQLLAKASRMDRVAN